MDSPSSPHDETVNEPAGARLLRNPWLWVGVFAAGVALVGAFAFLAQRDKRLAREEYDKALRDYLAAGLPDPFATPAPRGPVPTAAQGNLLFAPVFDGLMVIRPGSGVYANCSANESAAIRAKLNAVGQFTFCASGAPFWAFDPAAHFARKPGLSTLVAAQQSGESSTRAFIVPLEREFPELKSLAQIEASHPLAVSAAPAWSLLHGNDIPVPEFKSARATIMVMTAYAGCKALEGDGAPAAAAVCGLARHFEATDAAEGQSLVSSMLNVVIAKISIPRLTHLAIREGVWTDEQLRRVGERLGCVRLKDSMLASFCFESRASLVILKGIGDREPGSLRVANGLISGLSEWCPEMQAALSEPGLWRNATGVLGVLRSVADSRNARGQVDVAGVVALMDSIALQAPSASNAYMQLSIPAYSKVLANAAQADTHLASARLACALELYRRAHGAYPEKLDALVPQYLPSLPVSPWVGGKLEYAVTPAGYTLSWPKADYYDSGLGGVSVDVQHPGPWEILGEKIELPKRIRWFDTRTVTTSVAAPKDIVWTMPAPKNAKGFATPSTN